MDLFDIFQQYKIETNHSKAITRARDAEYKALDNKTEITKLNEKIEHLSLIVMAMGELLEDVGVSQSSLLSKIEEIDLRDGKLDGKLTTTTTNTCPKCARVVAGRRNNCLYCGAKIDKRSVF